ncbi:retroviral-like aspartic protease family protein [Candidatus Poribacteria bacterium]|nr:retroviral-like aspartic protease family protein [Candidatus Poribacteria bacterium]
MSFAFNPNQGLIIVQAELWGPSGNGILSLALDTGATSTLVNQSRLMQLGYDPAVVPERFQMTTGSGVEFVPRITLSQIVALGREHANFPVLCHTLPPSTGVDGLLGLDFLRGQTLTLDFRNGRITFV